MATAKIVLSGENFRKLVRGEVILVDASNGVVAEVMLSDIGFPIMKSAIEEAEKTRHENWIHEVRSSSVLGSYQSVSRFV
jgi:hypothetical protein